MMQQVEPKEWKIYNQLRRVISGHDLAQNAKKNTEFMV